MANFEYRVITNVQPGDVLVCTELKRTEDGSLIPRVSFDIVVSTKERRSRKKIAFPLSPAYLIGLGTSDGKEFQISDDDKLRFHFGAKSAENGLSIPCTLPTLRNDGEIVSEKIIRRAQLEDISEYFHKRAKMLINNVTDIANW